MNREIDINEISDGKLYEIGDMVKLGVDDCSGCHACCCGMGDSVVLDPYDVFNLEKCLNLTFEKLQEKYLDLRVVDGVILPCLRMNSDVEIQSSSAEGKTIEVEKEACAFLNSVGRCSIHEYRPGFCRLFPLGRIYENDTHKYFLQINECHKERMNKAKIKKWLGVPAVSKYEKYVDKWHYFVKGISDKVPEMSEDQLKAINIALLKTFFMDTYDIQLDFYEQFESRIEEMNF